MLTVGGCGSSGPPSPSVEPSNDRVEGLLIATTPALPWAARRPNGFLAQLCGASRQVSVARFDLCYELTALDRPAATDRDRFLLRVYGSVIADDGPGVDAWQLAVRPASEPAARIVATWPRGAWTEPCREVPVELPNVDRAGEGVTVCPVTTVMVGPNGDVTMTWTCPDCPPPRRATLGATLDLVAEVAAGAAPSWEIRAAAR